MRLTEYLKREKMTPMRFAREIGCHYQSIYNYVRKGTKPTLTVAKKIIDYTSGEVDINDLLTEKPEICEHCGQRKK